MALAAALLGWMFDGAEMGIFSMVGRPAVKDLLRTARREGDVGLWFSVITAGFLVGAATGGVLFGWLGDRIGRVRAMTLSVLTYAAVHGPVRLCAARRGRSACCGSSPSLGMGGEWSLGVALVMEVWPNRSRAFMAGLIGAAANVGYLLVGLIGLALISLLGTLHERTARPSGCRKPGSKMLVAQQRLAADDDAGHAAGAADVFHPHVRARIGEVGEGARNGSTSHWATQDLLGVLVGLAGPALIVYCLGLTPDSRRLRWLAVQIVARCSAWRSPPSATPIPCMRYLPAAAASASGGDSWRPTLRPDAAGGLPLAAWRCSGTWGSTQ